MNAGMSSDPTRDVLITGVGVISPIGFGHEEFWASLMTGRSGVQTLQKRDPAYLPAPFGAELLGFDPKKYVRPRKSLKVMSNEIQWGFAAADLAMADAGLTTGAFDPEQIGVIFGCDMIYSDIEELIPAYQKCIVNGEFNFDLWGQLALGEMYPLWMLKHLPNMPACHIGIAHDVRGPTNSISLGEVSSLLAIIEAMRLIERGAAEIVIAGGTGTRLHPAAMAYRGDFNLSRRVEAPERASRPFDAGRDGMVNGEGSAAFILESRAHAELRQARIYGRALSGVSGFEPRKAEQPPQGTAVRGTITGALRAAGLEPDAIGHVNAHGLSTVEHDRAEAQAIHALLGDVPVTAPKSFFGNLGAGTGAVEMAASVLALQHGHIPATLNYEERDPACPVNVVRDPLAIDRRTALVLSQATMGQAAAVVIAADG